ncbi:hypothetical protein NSK_008672 [Nannochloropsis salina CCMP1776]|uniref:RRM domain-containing protein n=1 Tax=Nannochloropsis salina CCMP1776 TaxID=1027361 RepID=A0A4D9CR95_9STRA|nr:hypothetical protein NSK_008672 [Nannochloropsis salina CCMP1776]|eukprot:TFJ80115.1 hypothetical protein NSK_008672 [Nannochloropsis salina CCMP1776]
METAGRVLDVEVQAHSDTGRSKGWALVTFEAAEDASRAMELLCGREVEGRPLYVREDRTEIEKEEGFVVFVGNLPWDMTASGLRTVFSEFRPYDVHIKTNMSGRSRGFGLLRFRSSEEAQRAIEQMHGITVQERKILVRLDRAHLEIMGHSPATMEASDTVTCGNIPWHTGDEVLACHMAQAGRVVSCQIQRHADTLRSKGWAIIRYVTVEEGTNAVRSLHRTVLDDRTLNVRFYRPNKTVGEEDASTSGFPSAYAVAPLGGERGGGRRGEGGAERGRGGRRMVQGPSDGMGGNLAMNGGRGGMLGYDLYQQQHVPFQHMHAHHQHLHQPPLQHLMMQPFPGPVRN